MPKHDAKGRSSGNGRHVRFYAWEMKSAAFQALRPNEVRVYLELRRRYNGGNNGSISLSTREAGEVCQAGNSTGARAIQRLVELGFAKVKKESTFGQKRIAREYELTALSLKPCKADQVLSGSKEFMSWTEAAIKKLDADKARKKKPSPTHAPHSPTRGNRGHNVVRLGVV